MKLEKFSGNPILAPNPGQAWESLAVCNPGVIHHQGVFHMLYRAAGDDPEHVIRFGLATSRDGFNFKREQLDPVFSPSVDGDDAGCIEDPRIIKVNGHFLITYAYRPYSPGKYWLAPDQSAYNPRDKNQPKAFGENLTSSGLLISKNLKTFRRLGRISDPTVDDRDAILFPEKIKGQYALLHRPKQWTGRKYKTKYPAIWICFGRDPLKWGQDYLLAKAKFPWERKIGGSTPPIKHKKGWLVIYHAVDANGAYHAGAMVLDLKDPRKVLGRAPQPILSPEARHERHGLYPHGAVFPTGNVVVDGKLFVYYGCADKYIGIATADFDELVNDVLQFGP
jgi:beta-1,2-mannobiose phosphorylase / 1,2-beta-oligomannan phosphorylase